jgi:hypothetical protein
LAPLKWKHFKLTVDLMLIGHKCEDCKSMVLAVSGLFAVSGWIIFVKDCCSYFLAALAAAPELSALAARC